MQEYLGKRYVIILKEKEIKKETESNKKDDIEWKITEFHMHKNVKEITAEFNNKVSKIDLMRKLQLLKLRLNFSHDKDIIEILDFYVLIVSQNSKDEEQISKGWEKLFILTELAQKMLKSEWEKVKKETLK